MTRAVHPAAKSHAARPDIDAARTAARALGPRPRAALAALAGCGMSDAEIARYYRQPESAIAGLRRAWSIAPGETG